MHYGRLSGGTLKLGDTVLSSYDKDRRAGIARAHSATHMLQSALREVLGDHVHQAGSLVQDDVLRFDFTNMTAVSKEDLAKIETLVNRYILSGSDVVTDIMSLEDARKSGATALFGEKYGSTVRVVKMGDFSAELCGGTHLSNTAKAGSFHILSEASVASGVRRIEAVTGMRAVAQLQEASDLLSSVSAMFKAAPSDLPDRINAQAAEIRELKKVIEQYKAKESSGNAGSYRLWLPSSLPSTVIRFPICACAVPRPWQPASKPVMLSVMSLPSLAAKAAVSRIPQWEAVPTCPVWMNLLLLWMLLYLPNYKKENHS